MRRIIWYALLALLPATMYAQATKSSVSTAKAITVAQGEPYTDHITLTNDVKDRDLMVKFVFNEEANTLTVSLISYRRLFVFWDDTRYKGVFSGSGKLHVDKLSYVITSNPKDRFRLGKTYRKSLTKPRKKHIFKKWIDYEGLQPVEKERNMVNDFIEQTFDIQSKRNNVVVKLRDILLMDQTKQKGDSRHYELSYGRNLDTDYQVTLQRNPCFGKDEELATANKNLTGITTSYKSFKRKYGKAELGIDIIMLSIPCFDQYMSFGNDIIRAVITALVYSVLMCIMRSAKLRKYSAIAAFISILVYTAVRFCLIKIIQ